MKKTLTSTLLLLCCLVSLKLTAQDIHYSQFYASPLTLNPALTGVIQGQYRIGAMYRNQWASVSNNPYVTPSISFDWNGIATKYIKGWTLSGGVLVLNDNSGDGSLNNLEFAGSLAERFFIGKGAKNSISIGEQIYYAQESFNPSALTFESEFTGTGFNPNNGGMPTFSKTSFGYFGVNLGALYSSKISKTVDFYGGGALFNINQPSQSFEGSSSNDLPMRWILHAGFRIGLTNQLALLPAALFMRQDEAQETDLGTSLSYTFKGTLDDAELYVGGYVRLNDAIIPVVGLGYKNVSVGISYDINTSSLTAASNDKGGIEISLSYIGLFSMINERPVLFCPRY